MITFQGIFEVSFLDYLKSKLSANIEVLQNTLHGSYSCIYHQNFIDACTTANWSQIIPMSCIYPAAYPLLRLSSSHDSQMKNTVHTIKDLHGYHPQAFEHNVSDSKSYHSPCCLDAGVQSPKEISDLFCNKIFNITLQIPRAGTRPPPSSRDPELYKWCNWRKQDSLLDPGKRTTIICSLRTPSCGCWVPLHIQLL